MKRTMIYCVILTLVFVITTPYITFAAADEMTVISVSNDYPFSYYDVDGRPTGYAVEFLRKFAKEEGLEIHVELYPTAKAFDEFKNRGDIFYDGSFYRLVSGGRSLPLFVQEYYLYTSSAMAKEITPDDLHSFYEASSRFKGYKVGIKRSQVIDDYIDSLTSEDNIKSYETISDVFSALQRGDVDIAILPFHQSNSVLEHYNMDGIEFVDQKLYFKNTTYTVKDDQLLHKLDSFILTSKKSGYITALNNTWLSQRRAGRSADYFLRLFNLALGLSIAVILFLIYRSNTLQSKVNSRTKQLREKLDENRKLYDEIIRHEKFKNDYFINLSHELRTPLNVILGAIQLNELYINKKSYDKLLENADCFTSIIKSNSFRLLRVVNNLIDITKMDADKYILNIDLVDIVYLSEELTSAIQPYADKKDIRLSVHCSVDEAVIECDPFEIERVIMNLLSNAIKFSNKSGTVKLNIEYVNDGEELAVSVTDTGIGISPENHEKIFDRFAQVDTTLNRTHEGHGIGLSLVKNIIELHGGSIRVDSEKGAGATFTFTLPVKTPYVGFQSSDIRSSMRHHNRQHAVSLEFSEIQQDFENQSN